jgi:PRA1 family protein
MAVHVASGADGSDYPSSKQQPIAVNIETMRLQLSSFAARIQSRVSVDTLRPLPMFLGLNSGAGFCLSSQAFTPPVRKMDKATPEKIRSRVKLNFAFFLSNYVLLAAMTAIVVALMHPGMVLFLAIVYGLWKLHAFLIRNQLVVFGIQVHALLTVQQRFYLLFAITTLVVVWKCLTPTLIFISISGLMVLSHALLRDPKDVDSFGSEKHDSDEEDVEGGGDNSSGSSEVLVERPGGKRRGGDS